MVKSTLIALVIGFFMTLVVTGVVGQTATTAPTTTTTTTPTPTTTVPAGGPSTGMASR